MSTTTVTTNDRHLVSRSRRAATSAFFALLLRDLRVLRKQFVQFLLRTIMQPLMFVFVFAYVFPKIGQGVGGNGDAAANFSSLLVAGVVAIACIFQGIQAVALPLVSEFGYTREVEDRVMAPLPVTAVALEKIFAGAVQGIVASLVIFPLAAFVPATPVHLTVNWPLLITSLLVSSALGAAFGLTLGTRFPPRSVPLLFGVIVIPITFLGAVYYPWAKLEAIPWLKTAVLINPLVYMSEAFRASLISKELAPHMEIVNIYAGLLFFLALFTWMGVRGFRKRVIS